MEWLKRSLSRGPRNGEIPKTQTQSNSKGRLRQQQDQEEEQRIYGITEELINHVKIFTIDTFKKFPLQDGDLEAQSTSTKVSMDLSQWQEKHAILILSRVKEISQLRYALCPRHLKENQFWRIYFLLARNHIVEYELRAIQQEKLQQMAMEDEKFSDNSPYEIEMAEAKHGNFIEPLPPS